MLLLGSTCSTSLYVIVAPTTTYKLISKQEEGKPGGRPHGEVRPVASRGSSIARSGARNAATDRGQSTALA
jgi:hypothetical protein